MYRCVTVLIVLFSSTGAMAQVVQASGEPTYLAVTSPNAGGYCGPPPPYCMNPQFGIPLNYYATSGSISSLSARLDAATAAFSSQIAALDNRISGAYDVATVAAAMRDAIPNQGDRFAIRLNAAAMNGYAAAAIGLGVNLTDNARLAINYGRGRTESMVSGGVNLSFH
jgi:hypothetical protein